MTYLACEVIIFIIFLAIAGILLYPKYKASLEIEREHKKAKAEFEARNAMISGEKKLTGIKKFKQKLLYNMDVVHMPHNVFYTACVASGVVGFFFGRIVLSTVGLSIVCAIGFLFIPAAFIAVQANWYKQKEAISLENCMVMVTSSYRSTNDIIKAIECNIDKPDMPVAFRTFLTDVTFVDASVERALHKMAASIDNPFFDEWVDVLIKSQNDRNMIELLPIIIDEMNEAKKAQIESQSAMKGVWKEYALWVGTVAAVPLILKLNQAWYNALVYTAMGKIMLFFLMVGLANTVRQMIKISRPLK